MNSTPKYQDKVNGCDSSGNYEMNDSYKEQSTLNSTNSSLNREMGVQIEIEDMEVEHEGKQVECGMISDDFNGQQNIDENNKQFYKNIQTCSKVQEFDNLIDQVQNLEPKHIVQSKIENIKAKYHIGPVLGEGSVGVVRYGYERGSKLSSQCAIKIIEKHDVEFDNYNTELEILQKINHENILKIYDLLHDKKRHFQVWELAQLGDLFDFQSRFQNRQVPENIVKQIAIQMLEALCHLDSQDIIHRDIKPENILITNFDSSNGKIQVKLADFDAAKFCPKDKAMIGKAGTLEYMAPEMFLKHCYGSNIDVWSLCVVIYTQLFGRWPFSGTQEDVIKINVCKKEPSYRQQFLGEISQEAVDFLKFGLIKDKRKRPSCQQMLDHPWLKSQI